MNKRDRDNIYNRYILKEQNLFDDPELLEALQDEFYNIGIRGEYWDQDGYLIYADGDVGDFNHEAIAEQHAIGLLASQVPGFNSETENLSVDDIINFITDEYEWESEELKNKFFELIENYDKEEALLLIIGDTPDNRELLSSDYRKLAVEKWDWIAIRGNSIEMKELSRDNLKRLANVLEEALEIEGIKYSLENKIKSFLRNNENEIFDILKNMDVNTLSDFILDNVITFGVSTYTGKSYTVTLNDLKKGNVMGLTHDPNKTKGKLIMHPDLHKDVSSPVDYYKNKPIGDSYKYRGKFDVLIEKLKNHY